MNGKSQNTIKQKLVGLFVNNETVYRTWRTFLQAAAGVLAAGLSDYLMGKFAGQSTGKVVPYFIATAVAAGISAVMNRGEKKKSGVHEETKEKTEREEAVPPLPRETSEGEDPSEGENAESESGREEKEGEINGENG